MSVDAGDMEMAPLGEKYLDAPSSAAADRAELEAEMEEDGKMSCGDFCSNLGKAISAKSAADWGATGARIAVLITSIYFFLFSLDLMGTSFKVSRPHYPSCIATNALMPLLIRLPPISLPLLTPRRPCAGARLV
jgi:hypothetical protein